jgi:hypothetical protein
MDAVRLAALIGFVALAGLVVYVVLRSRTVGRESRESLAFRRSVAALHLEVDATLAAVLSVVDEVRHHRLAAVDALPAIDQSVQAVRGQAASVAALPATAAGADGGARLAEDLARAERALDRIQHGVWMLADATARIGDLEGQTAVKRGYLELQHARDAFARDATTASAAPTMPARGA